MLPPPAPASFIDACARGVVEAFETHHNTAGLPWATFQLLTAPGRLPCVCFPRTYAQVSALLTRTRTVVVCGRVAPGDPGEMWVLQVDGIPR